MINDESPIICVGNQTFRLERELGDWPGQVGGAKSHHHSEKKTWIRIKLNKRRKRKKHFV